MYLGQFVRSVDDLDLFTDKKLVEVEQSICGCSGVEVEPKGCLAVTALKVKDQSEGDDPRLGRRQKNLAAGARGKPANVVRAQVVQESDRVGTGHLHLAAS